MPQLPSWIKYRIKSFLAQHDYVLTHIDDGKHAALARRKQLLAVYNTDLVIDVGANNGQYAIELRSLGYQGRIHSFEPMRDAWGKLGHQSHSDSDWTITNVGLADEPGYKTLHVAGNSVSSSLLSMSPMHVENAPGSDYVSDERVEISTLDLEVPKIVNGASNIWLKLDVQGFESKVLEGAKNSLEDISVIQTELSLTTLYEGGDLYLSLCEKLARSGFALVGIEPGFKNRKTGQLLQFDGIFAHESAVAGS